jgi:hypothetical protein
VAANRKSRVLALALAAAAAAAGGCKKGGEDRRKTEAPIGAQAGGEAAGSPTEAPPGDPHAGLDMSGGGGDPHAGMDMSGGGGANPHAGMDMSGGGNPAAAVEVDKDGKSIIGPLRLAIPKSWKNQPAGGMRAAQWEVPGPKGAAAASLVVYYFGQGGAGGVEDNLQRWYSQFQPEGGGKEVTPKTESKTVGGMKITLTEVEGRYVASMMPGSAEKNDEPGWMLLGAIAETPAGPYYFKLTGPKATVSAARKDFRAALDTAQLKN